MSVAPGKPDYRITGEVKSWYGTCPVSRYYRELYDFLLFPYDELSGMRMRNNETFRVIWDGDSESDCVDVCRELKRAGIVYRVAQQPVSRSIRMRVDWRFQVGVLGCDYESAREALGLSAATDDNVEYPESIYPISKPSDAEDESRAAGSYLKAWHPENATVEIWSQVAPDTIVTMALRENLIHYRLQPTKNGAYKLFVRPEDEARAREIVGEIERGEPPR